MLGYCWISTELRIVSPSAQLQFSEPSLVRNDSPSGKPL